MARIRKIRVTEGIHWLEIPDADLRVLCGCPPDAVKHLMRRGLILPVEEGGHAFESGPNAILLSDVMLQGGVFANLAEFPVLQMLYRQGMILPGHPRNNGDRPLLIGVREQVSAQLNYIYRGNYGLVSEEEIIEAGLDAKCADVLMQVKRHFAFGAIEHPSELFDTRIVGREPVAVRNGASVRRLALNQYEFAYGGETAVVDLNLGPDETYRPAFRLGFHKVERGYFSVIHSGEGDGWDTDRPTLSSVIVFQGNIYLVDAGPHLQYILNALGIGVNEIQGIFHTHCHDDHFAGLTTLMRADHRIRYYATPLVRASVAKKLSALLSIEEADFQEYFDIHDLVADEWNDIDGLEVRPTYSPHPVETTFFTFRALGETGYRTYAHVADIASFDVMDRFAAAVEDRAVHDLIARTKLAYLESADVKKIDIGGGLIHGAAVDFRTDRSRKIVLAHLARALTPEEREIGSGAPFGTADDLIHNFQGFVWRFAYEFLTAYFPSVPVSSVRVLLNNAVDHFNPESIIIREGEVHDHVYLVLTGNVERIDPATGRITDLSAGALIGDRSGVNIQASDVTYRAASFVQALRLNVAQFLEFIRRHDLMADMEALEEKRAFLRGTWLFGESLSYPVQHRVATELGTVTLKADEEFLAWKHDAFFMIVEGKVERFIGSDRLEVHGPGDFFGEGAAVFDTPPVARLRALTPTTLYAVPAETARAIPIVRWKLFETFTRRMRLITDSGIVGAHGLDWRVEFATNVQRVDLQHRKSFETARTVTRLIESDAPSTAILEAFGFLVDYMAFHFEDEIALLRQYGWPEADIHESKHFDLLERAGSIRQALAKAEPVPASDLEALIKDWIVTHILTEDRRFGAFLNGKGVY